MGKQHLIPICSQCNHSLKKTKSNSPPTYASLEPAGKIKVRLQAPPMPSTVELGLQMTTVEFQPDTELTQPEKPNTTKTAAENSAEKEENKSSGDESLPLGQKTPQRKESATESESSSTGDADDEEQITASLATQQYTPLRKRKKKKAKEREKHTFETEVIVEAPKTPAAEAPGTTPANHSGTTQEPLRNHSGTTQEPLRNHSGTTPEPL